MKIWRIISFFLLLVAVQTASGRKIKMVDRKATKETRALYKYLLQLQQRAVMFGHHDFPSYGIGWRGDKDRSDVKDITGDHPAVYSLDMHRINDRKIELVKDI
mgnify:FL=1